VDSLLNELSQGQDLYKIKGGGILYQREYFLDSKTLKLSYTGSRKKFRKKPTACKYP